MCSLLHSFTDLFSCFTVDRLVCWLTAEARTVVSVCSRLWYVMAGAFPADVYLCFFT